MTQKNTKVSIIGAGSVGASLAQRVLENDLADVILVDIDEGIAKGKAYDLQDASPIIGYEKDIEGTSDFSKIRGSDIVVMAAGFPRKPGMTREDLIQKNGDVIKDVSLKIKEFAPESILIVVTNPLDVMSYLAHKVTGFDRHKIMGMAGVLDGARCANLAAQELDIMRTEIDAVVIGSHDPNMVPLFEHSQAQGKPLKVALDAKKQNSIAERTRKRGAEIVSLLKSGSAFFAPSAAGFSMIKSILNNEHLTLCASVYLDGEYGLRDIFIGAPVMLGKDGIEKIVELDLKGDESEKLKKAAELVKNSISKLKIE
jgi:malate dehydrogenase